MLCRSVIRKEEKERGREGETKTRICLRINKQRKRLKIKLSNKIKKKRAEWNGGESLFDFHCINDPTSPPLSPLFMLSFSSFFSPFFSISLSLTAVTNKVRFSVLLLCWHELIMSINFSMGISREDGFVSTFFLHLQSACSLSNWVRFFSYFIYLFGFIVILIIGWERKASDIDRWEAKQGC